MGAGGAKINAWRLGFGRRPGILDFRSSPCSLITLSEWGGAAIGKTGHKILWQPIAPNLGIRKPSCLKHLGWCLHILAGVTGNLPLLIFRACRCFWVGNKEQFSYLWPQTSLAGNALDWSLEDLWFCTGFPHGRYFFFDISRPPEDI